MTKNQEGQFVASCYFDTNIKRGIFLGLNSKLRTIVALRMRL